MHKLGQRGRIVHISVSFKLTLQQRFGDYRHRHAGPLCREPTAVNWSLSEPWSSFEYSFARLACSQKLHRSHLHLPGHLDSFSLSPLPTQSDVWREQLGRYLQLGRWTVFRPHMTPTADWVLNITSRSLPLTRITERASLAQWQCR